MSYAYAEEEIEEAETAETMAGVYLAGLTITGTIPSMSVGRGTSSLSGITLAGFDQNGDSFSLAGLTPTWAIASGAAYASLSGTTLTPVAVGSGTVTATIYNVTSNALPFSVSPLVITTSALKQAVAGKSYSKKFTASGGTAPYTYTESGTLPNGLSFSDNCLSGTPTVAGSFPITITATDANGFTCSESYTLVVRAK
ncbi:MAG: putative Ig domain-containing protein [Thermacetogeniaceae bacterium]|jgi:hypothetical protein